MAKLFASYIPHTACEEIPGFRGCFGGEELRRTQAAMTCALVGGTIEALLATDMPPSLARLSSFSPRPQAAGKDQPRPLVSGGHTGGAAAAGGSGVAPLAPTSQHGSVAGGPVSSTSSAPANASPQQAELEHMVAAYRQELAALGVSAPAPNTTLAHITSLNQEEDGPSVPATPGAQGQATQPQQQEPATTPHPLVMLGSSHASPWSAAPAPGGALVPLHVAAARLQPGAGAHASACFDAAYGCGLVLQDLALHAAPASTQHQAHLQEACEMYRMAVCFKPSAHSALYNWGVALSDLAHTLRPTDPASAKLCLQAAGLMYAEALAMHPDMPQALNNWGLVLQELSSMAKARSERDMLLKLACAKFRQAVRLRPEFDRAIYNLGTVCYATACTLQGELAAATPLPPTHTPPVAAALGSGRGAAQATGGPGWGGVDSDQQRQAQEAEVRTLFSSAAQYIVMAYALQPVKDIYRKSLGVVKRLLPLPFLRAGYLTCVIPTSRGTPEESWRQDWFVLDSASLRSATSAEGSLSTVSAHLGPSSLLRAGGALGAPTAADSEPHALVLPLSSMAHAARLRDPTLPKGAAFAVVLRGAHCSARCHEVVMVAEDEEAADAWVDVLRLAAHAAQSRSAEALAEALLPQHGHLGSGVGMAGVSLTPGLLAGAPGSSGGGTLL